MLSFRAQEVNPYIDMDAWHAREAVETGSLPDWSNTDSSIVEIERDKYREGGDVGGVRVPPSAVKRPCKVAWRLPGSLLLGISLGIQTEAGRWPRVGDVRPLDPQNRNPSPF